MRLIALSLLFTGLLSLLSGCNSSSTAPHPDKVFTDAQRTSCPQNPFRPEFPMAPKHSAMQAVIHFHMEIYTSRGAYITEADGDIDPASTSASSPSLAWNGRDASGKQVPSGYYFMVVTYSDAGSGAQQTKAQCYFYVNPADQDKVK